jgi:hypothetical protein
MAMKFRRRAKGTQVERICVDVLPKTNDFLAKLAVQYRAGVGQVLDNLVEQAESTIIRNHPATNQSE